MTTSKDPSGPKIVAMPLEDARRARGQSLVALPRSKVASLRAFRRIRADRIFGALGVLLILIGVVLVFTWEKPPVVEKKYGVDWVMESHDLKTETKLVTTGTSTPYDLAIAEKNVTAVTVSLQWTDDVAGPDSDQVDGDRFELTVQGPPGTNVSIKDTRIGGKAGMNISYTLPMSGIPDVASVPAATEAQALAALGDRSNTTGTGSWKVTVRLVSANASWSNDDARTAANGQCPAAVPNVCQPDNGNSFTFSFHYTTYHSRLEKE